MSLKLKIVILLIATVKQTAGAWGFYGHKVINKHAVFSLPNGPLFSFFKSNIEYITENSVNPDKRRYTQEDEACRHYIDLEAYGDSMPTKYFNDAKKRYSEDTLKKHGILPWQIYRVQGMLTKAMIDKDAKKVLAIASDLGHYVGDAHVPLHTTRNYDGQLTNQKGIHALWETRLPELYTPSYELLPGQATYVNDVQKRAWEAVLTSNSMVDSVLSLELSVSNSLNTDEKFSFEDRNFSVTRVYSQMFSEKYHLSLQGQVERRMTSAIKMVADLWYTSWIEAGQPDLTALPLQEENNHEAAPKEKIKNERFLESHRNCSHEEPNHSSLTLKHN